MFFFEDEITFYYEVLAEHDKTVDCGSYAIEFSDESGAPLDPSVFNDGSDSTQEIRKFQIFPPTSADYIDVSV